MIAECQQQAFLTSMQIAVLACPVELIGLQVSDWSTGNVCSKACDGIKSGRAASLSMEDTKARTARVA